jgi:multidrug efflux system membrane fusion protein
VTPGAQGTLSFIDNAVDTTTGTVMLKATFPNASGTLWPGEFVSTSLRVFVERNALVVPAQAVLTGQQGTYVYVVNATATARQRLVSIERTAGNVAVIASGLSDGERVVTDGQSRVTPGGKVAISTGSLAAAPATSAARRSGQR